MSAPEFNEIIHAPTRLRICGLLRRVAELEYAVIRDALGITDVNLSKHLKVLADAGLVNVRKEGSPRRTDARKLTWVSITPSGSRALEAHLAALASIAEGVSGMPN